MKKFLLLPLIISTHLLMSQKSPPTSMQIGPMDGTSYEVISSSTIAKPSFGWCGLNDFLIPNLGQFRREVRKYSLFNKGYKVDEWFETHDQFIDCIQF